MTAVSGTLGIDRKGELIMAEMDYEDGQKWLAEHFEEQFCAECGKDVEDHEACIVWGNWFARCTTNDDTQEVQDACVICGKPQIDCPCDVTDISLGGGDEEGEEAIAHWTTGSGLVNLAMTLEQAESASHQGKCDDDVLALMRHPAIQLQLDAIDPVLLASELEEYGAWDSKELADHSDNLQRLVWLAAGDIRETPSDYIDGYQESE